MAVQAQYPSNILLLDRRVAVEGKNDDCSLQLQSQPGGKSARFVDDPSRNHILLNDFPVCSSGGNSTKRRREIDMNQFMSLIHQQQFHNQTVDVTQLRSRNVDVSTGLQLAFNDHQQLQRRHSLSPQSSVLSLLSGDVSTQINQQRNEIEHFLHAQGEELRRTLESKRQMHYYALLRTAEERISRRIKDKEAEAEKAARRNAELEARAEHLIEEAKIWQARCRAQEAEAAALQSQLQQAILSGRRGGNCLLSQGGEAAEEEVGLQCAAGDAEDAESAYVDPERLVLASGPGCKACGNRVASVVLLPCRHLCVCTECDGVVSACPLCLSLRSSSIEVYMS